MKRVLDSPAAHSTAVAMAQNQCWLGGKLILCMLLKYVEKPERKYLILNVYKTHWNVCVINLLYPFVSKCSVERIVHICLGYYFRLNWLQTRMHSSRMRTGRLSPVSPGMHYSRGCTWSGGIWSGGCVLVPGVYLSMYCPLWTRFWKYYLAPNFVCGR